MATCKYKSHESDNYPCGRESCEETNDGFCILHSPNPEKDQKAFEEALTVHRERLGDIFTGFVFPANSSFEKFEFTGKADFTNADFRNAKFTGGVAFSGAEFTGNTSFRQTMFSGDATFVIVKFSGDADFAAAEFAAKADFAGAEFTGNACFSSTKFIGDARFIYAKFAGADFRFAWFRERAEFGNAWFRANADFRSAEFFARTLFVSWKEDSKIIPLFSENGNGAEIDFSDAVFVQPDAVIFRDVALTTCRFRGTDLRKVEITGALLPKIGSRFGVYDEMAPLADGETREWHHIEKVYRELKQNYEDRKDYERASDFHYGEKEMRRRNPETSPGLRFLLTLYWLVSGYGERWVRPLIWMAGVLMVSTVCYLRWGLLRLKDSGPVLDWTNVWETCLYSFKVMTFLKPTNFEPVGLGGDLIYTVQSILGPILIGLFALAVRQRLKR